MDVKRVVDSKKLRAGVGKMRNRRHRMRRGPLIVYGEDKGLVKAFRNIPGVETVGVSCLSHSKLTNAQSNSAQSVPSTCCSWPQAVMWAA